MNDADLSNARTQAVLAVEAVMPEAMRETFLRRVVEMAPALDGAMVADILDIYESMDARLDVIEDERYEAVYDALEAAWGDSSERPGVGSLVASYALYACLYGQELTDVPPTPAAVIRLGEAAIQKMISQVAEGA